MVVMTENKKKLNAADLASLLRSEINLGQYVRDDKLPTERDMADTYWRFPRHSTRSTNKINGKWTS